MWFIGLVFQKSQGGGVKITITSEIQTFTNHGECSLVYLMIKIVAN